MDHKNQSFVASFFFSTRLMAVLFLTFAVAMGIGTFIENDYNTDTARALVYNTWWFEAIMVFFVINFFGNIKRYDLLNPQKWASLMLHLSFILIIAGAFVTRYISYEGMMPIREGATANQIFSDKTFLPVFVDGEYQGEMKRKTYEKPLLLSPAIDNDFSIKDDFNSIPFEISYANYIMNGKEKIVEDKDGVVYLKMVEAGAGGRHEHYLKSGEVVNIHNILFALNKPTAGAVNINTEEATLQAPFEGTFMRMADKLQGKVVKDSKQPLMMRSLYNVGGAQFVFPDPAMKGKKTYVSNNDYKDKKTDDVLVVKLKQDGQEKEVSMVGARGKMGEPQTFKIGKLEYTLFFGSKVYDLPFSVTLNDFIADKYPGTENSYSAFESRVTVKDSAEKFKARIYMNHVLDYKGYRLFQASFDPDEKGTVLSVNHDFWGTWITYVGYFFLFLGMLGILFTSNSRFGDLKRKLEKVKDKKAKLTTLVVLLMGLNSFAQNHSSHDKGLPTPKQIDSLISAYNVDEAHAARFGRLVIQDEKGRMKPINTFSSELLRKVSKSDTYKDMNSDQVFLSITRIPQVWYNVPLIYIKRDNDSIRKIIG